MKQFFITIAALLAFVGCVTEIADPQVGEPEQVAEFVKLNIELSAAGETKAIKSSWEEGDNIYLYFLEENDTTFTKKPSAVITYNVTNGQWLPQQTKSN